MALCSNAGDRLEGVVMELGAGENQELALMNYSSARYEEQDSNATGYQGSGLRRGSCACASDILSP